MERDLSKQLYERYFQLSDKRITVMLKDGRSITGHFTDFTHGDPLSNEAFILQWHIVSNEQNDVLGLDPFGFINGEYIQHQDIIEITFHQDNSIMHFHK